MVYHSAISVCVINYNGAPYLAGTLAAIEQQSYPVSEIILVDNGSTDDSLALVASHYPSVHIVAQGYNAGAASARNSGYGAARHELILFVDHDVKLAPNCIQQLSAALSAYPLAAVAMPLVLDAQQPDVVQYAGASPHFSGLMTLHAAGSAVDSLDKKIDLLDTVISACLLVNRAHLGREPPWDERFFIYLEDHDFGLRVRLGGWMILSVPTAHVYHGAGTEHLALRTTGYYAPLRVKCLIANRWRVIAKNYHRRTLVALASFFIVYEMVQFLGVVKKGWLFWWWQALSEVMREWPALQDQRNSIQRARRTDDRYLLRGGPLPFTVYVSTDHVERSAIRLLNACAAAYWKIVHRWL